VKTFNKTILAALLSLGATAFAAPFTNIADTYLGGNDNVSPARDVIGPVDELDIHSMDVTINRTSGTLSVQINTNWFDPDLSGDDGDEYHVNTGDLFISTNGWTSASDGSDNADNGEAWEYVLNTRTGQIIGGNFGILRTQDEMTGPLLPPGETENWYRDNQETRYKDGGTDKGKKGTVTWSDGVGFIRYDLLLTDIGIVDPLNDALNLGFHWTITCGNDVIEGGVLDEGGGGGGGEVPEPGTLLLAGLGLVGLGLRRKTK
jgi:PEP-CTERM motif